MCVRGHGEELVASRPCRDGIHSIKLAVHHQAGADRGQMVDSKSSTTQLVRIPAILRRTCRYCSLRRRSHVGKMHYNQSNRPGRHLLCSCNVKRSSVTSASGTLGTSTNLKCEVATPIQLGVERLASFLMGEPTFKKATRAK